MKTNVFRECPIRMDAMRTNRRRTMMQCAAGPILFAIAGAVAAQSDYPSKPVRMVAPFEAGGGSDLLARALAQKMGEQMSVPVLVENKPGANANIAAEFVVRAPADGYTLLFHTAGLALNPALYVSMSYDPLKDLAPVSLTGASPLVLAVSAAVPANTVAEFIAHVKANPGKIPFGSAGGGNLTHLSAALFLKAAGLEMNHVPYKGIGPAFQDLVAGHIAMVAASPVEVKPFIGQPGVNLLAVTSDKRASALPGVPSVAETLKIPSVVTWNAVLAATGTPQPIIDTLSREIMAAAKDPAFVAQLEKIGVDPIVQTPSEFGKMIAEDASRWRDIITALGIKQQQ